MKKILLSLALVAAAVGCGSTTSTKTSDVPEALAVHPEWALGQTVYELNTRQLTPEGTFAAAEKELPRLKEMGVDIVWVMPIQPIGVKERKGSLGSYYAISDYKGFNPEFGTREDFEKFLATAHSLGLKVILDWVANHTSPDNVWAVHEGWHKRDSLGAMKVQYDWTDISELEYDNKNMRTAMKDAMNFWADSIGVDGFRCDMAMLVPVDFWEEAVGEIRKDKPDFFMLAEAEEPYLTDEVFNAFYGWDMHHTLNAMAQGVITADSLYRQLEKTDSLFPERALRLNFISNHDENSWSGSEYERMGGAVEEMTALTYMLPGVPLIYSGQEFGNEKRLRFFDKDTIVKVEGAPQIELYTSLNKLRDDNPALRYGETQLLQTSEPEAGFALVRTSGENRVVGVFNFSKDDVALSVEDIPSGEYTDFANGEKVKLPSEINLKGYGYKIFTR